MQRYRAGLTAAVAVMVWVATMSPGAAAAQPSADSVPARPTTSAPVDASRGVTRRMLASHHPINAPGQRLALERLTVAARARVPRLAHVGTVVLRGERGSGRLVLSRGSAIVTDRRGDAATVVAPAAVTVEPGVTVVVPPFAVFAARNRSDRPFVAALTSLDAQLVPGPVAPTGVESPSIRLATEIVSASSTLANADPALRYGWNNLIGDATLDSETVHCNMLGNVSYVSGAGPFFGFVTFTWPDSSSIVTQMFGESLPQPDGGAVVRAMLTVIGGTGRYSKATGFGSFDGARDATVGAPVRSVFTLTVLPS